MIYQWTYSMVLQTKLKTITVSPPHLWCIIRKHCTFVVISDCLEHNTVAVYNFQRTAIDYLQPSLEGSQLQPKVLKQYAHAFIPVAETMNKMAVKVFSEAT